MRFSPWFLFRTRRLFLTSSLCGNSHWGPGWGWVFLGLILSAALIVRESRPENPSHRTTSLPLDEPLRLLEQARRTYAGVRDYSCLLITRERVKGQMQPDQLISMKVRAKPFSVHLNWLAPESLKGMEACYVENRYHGMMRVHLTGVRGLLGFVSLSPQDPRVMEKSRHPITEAGIGNLIQRLEESWKAERTTQKIQVRLAQYEYNDKDCIRVETIQPESGGYAHRVVTYFDKETSLPIRVEVYDHPQPGGPPQGELLEMYSYANLRLNVNLGDETFQR